MGSLIYFGVLFLAKVLQGKYTVLDEPPSCGKDVNDELKIRVGITRMRKEKER